MSKKIIFIWLFTIAMLTGSYAQSFKVIVNSGNSINSLSHKELSDFMLKKKTKWADGKAVQPVDLSATSQTRSEFSQQVHGKSTAAIRNYWQQAAFSGTASAPAEKQTDAEVLEYVRKNAGAIGYISSSSGTSGVKVIAIK